MAEPQKILIAEVSDNTTWYNYFPYCAHVWVVATNNIYTGLISSDFEPELIGLENDLVVLSYSVRKEQYNSVNSITEVQLTEKTFYFDKDNRWLYIHYGDHKPYTFFKDTDLEIGFTLGFYQTNSESDGVWNDQQYYPRLISPTVFTDTKDDQFFAKQVLPAANVEIDNHDLTFKNFNIGYNTKKRNGNYVRTLVWTGDDALTADYADFNVTYQGIIERVSEGKTIKLQLRDLRSSLKTKSPARYLDTTNYTDIKNPDKEYTLPKVWGKCFDVPCICLNENVNKDVEYDDPGFTPSPTDYQFLLCDTSTHTLASDSIKTVFIDGTEVELSSLPTIEYNSAQNFAYITISEDEFREPTVNDSGVTTDIKWKRMNKVTVDVEGYLKGSEFRESDGSLTSSPTDLIENGMAVIREILKDNYGWDYLTSLYDITTWKSFEDDTDVTYKIGYYNNKPITTQKQVEEIASSMLGKFVWNENRRFSWDNDDFDEYKAEIPKTEMFPLDFFPQFNTDSTEVLSKYRTGYKRKWDERDNELSYEWDIDTSNEEDALIDFNSTFQKDFPTLINNLTETQKFAGRVFDFGSISNDTFSFTCNWDRYTLKAGEWILVQGDYSTGEYIGWCKCQIQEVKPNISNWTVTIKVRVFEIFPYLAEDAETGRFIMDEFGRPIIVGDIT